MMKEGKCDAPWWEEEGCENIKVSLFFIKKICNL